MDCCIAVIKLIVNINSLCIKNKVKRLKYVLTYCPRSGAIRGGDIDGKFY